jgi:hypothetical protein
MGLREKNNDGYRRNKALAARWHLSILTKIGGRNRPPHLKNKTHKRRKIKISGTGADKAHLFHFGVES